MFVIPCKFDPEQPVIFECVESIQQYHPAAKIVVVDSASDDKSYYGWLHDRGALIADINNRNYGVGAFAWAYHRYPHEPFYYLFYDSLIAQSSLAGFRDRELTTIRHWPSTAHDWGWDSDGSNLSVWGGKQLERMGIPFPDTYTGIMGPMMFAQNAVMRKLDDVGFWSCLPKTKYELCGMERVAGIVLEFLGYNVTNSLQGLHTVHEAPYDESYVKKFDLGRM